MSYNFWGTSKGLIFLPQGLQDTYGLGFITQLFLVSVLLFGSLVVLFMRSRITDKSNSEDVHTPPGDLNRPQLLQNLEFMKSSPDEFYKKRYSCYGETFKMKLFGKKSISVSTPEAAKFVLVTEQKNFRIDYMPSFKKIIGPENVTNVHGALHQTMRKMIQAPILPESLKDRVSWIDSFAKDIISSWKFGELINSRTVAMKYAFRVGLALACNPTGHEVEELWSSFEMMEKGLMSLAINIPGTAYSRALKGRTKVCQILGNIIARRKEGMEAHDDIIGSFVNGGDGGRKLTDAQIIDATIGVIFGAHDTTANVLVWTIKNLSENPEVLKQVKEEQFKVRSMKANEDYFLDWNDIKAMPYTLRLILETLRVANVIPFTWRETLQDMKYDGYCIPKGWKVLVWFSQFHIDPKYYKDPLTFNPARFENPPKPNTYLPFGTGTRVCPGKELAKLEILVFVHRLVTNWSWEMTGEDMGVTYYPVAYPKNGVPIKLIRKV